jgi:uncharacterized protein YqeY
MLREQLQKDQLVALKSGQKDTLSALRYIVSQIKYREIEKKSELSDDEIVQLLRKQIKELHEASDSAKKMNRNDLIEENDKQVEIYKVYLPQEISDEELEAEVKKLAETNASAITANPKVIIGMAMGHLKSKADPARIQATLRKLQMM